MVSTEDKGHLGLHLLCNRFLNTKQLALYKPTHIYIEMSINLDNEEQCLLCDLSYAHLDEFVSSQFKVLACRMTKSALYKTLWQYLEHNRRTMSLQGNNLPDISVEDLERHFEYHHVSIERTIVEQARKTQALQERLTRKLENKLDERNVKLFIQLSNHRIALTKKMNQFDSNKHIKVKPYIYE